MFGHQDIQAAGGGISVGLRHEHSPLNKREFNDSDFQSF